MTYLLGLNYLYYLITVIFSYLIVLSFNYFAIINDKVDRSLLQLSVFEGTFSYNKPQKHLSNFEFLSRRMQPLCYCLTTWLIITSLIYVIQIRVKTLVFQSFVVYVGLVLLIMFKEIISYVPLEQSYLCTCSKDKFRYITVHNTNIHHYYSHLTKACID